MFANDELMTIVEEVDVLVAEIRELNSNGPHFRIVHRFHAPGTDCAPGEEVAGIYLVHRSREFHLRLSLALRLLFDYLARHSRLPQSARQIEAGIRADRIYSVHADTGIKSDGLTRKMPRSYIRVYIARLRLALAGQLSRAKLQITADAVLISQETVMNEIGYRLEGTFEWLHVERDGNPY